MFKVVTHSSYPPDPKELWFIDLGSYARWGEYIPKKLCLLTLGQIESVIHEIKRLRLDKQWAAADALRDKLVEVGTFWFMPKSVNLGNLCGHTQQSLMYRVHKDEIYVEGWIYEISTLSGIISTEFAYSTNNKKWPLESSWIEYA